VSLVQASRPRIHLIVAYAQNRTIGRDNTLPWRLRGDLVHFRQTTLGHPVLMGRKTWESLGKPLPGRHNIVVSRNPVYDAPGATVVPSLDAALRAAAADANPTVVYIIGGAQIYQQALPLAHEIRATEVHAHVAGDAFFPVLDAAQWRETQRHAQAEENGLRYDFVTYCRAQDTVASRATHVDTPRRSRPADTPLH